MNGKMSTLLVFEDEREYTEANPFFDILREQAEKIEQLETQNKSLIEQEDVLLHLLELSAQTGNLMAENMKMMDQLKARLDKESDALAESVEELVPELEIKEIEK